MAISLRSKKTVEAITEWWLLHNAPTHLAKTDQRSLVDIFAEIRRLGSVSKCISEHEPSS